MTTEKGFLETYRASRTTVFDDAFWNAFVGGIDIRLKPLEQIKVDYDGLVQQGLGVALDRINQVLLPAAQRIQSVSTLGFLIVDSTTELTLVEGEKSTFLIAPGDQRDLFTPSPFVAVTRPDSTDDIALGRVTYWNATDGVLEIEIDHIRGDAGPHDDWQIVCGAGVASAMADMLTAMQALAAEVTAETGADRAAIALDKAAVDADQIAIATDRGLAVAAAAAAETARGLAVTAKNAAVEAADSINPTTINGRLDDLETADVALEARLDAIEAAAPGQSSAVALFNAMNYV